MSDSNLTNPIKAFFHDEFPEQYQEPPGLQKNMKPLPDCGEKSYKGSGKLTGRKALVGFAVTRSRFRFFMRS